MAPEFLEKNTLIDGKFVILEPIGYGGMGSVYKAKQAVLDRIVAIKILPQTMYSDEEIADRFEREAKILSKLENKSIAKFITYGFVNDGAYIAMEYIEGKSLRSLLNESKIEWTRAFKIAIQVCNTLAYAHKNDVVHRDLKPENILLREEMGRYEEIVLIDFGLASIIATSSKEQQRLTTTGELIGSVNYMSPEICRGQKADQRSDIYSVGCILFEMLSGAPPFTAETPIAIIYKHASDSVPTPMLNSEFPAAVKNIVAKSMARNVTSRYQSIEELSTELEACLTRGDTNTSLRDNQFKRFRLPTILISVMLTLIVGFVWKTQFTRSDKSTSKDQNSEVISSLSVSEKKIIPRTSVEAKLAFIIEQTTIAKPQLSKQQCLDELNLLIPHLPRKVELSLSAYT